MKTIKTQRSAQIFLCIGVILVTFPILFKEFIALPDFIRGTVAGIGIGMEIIGITISLKFRKQNCS